MSAVKRFQFRTTIEAPVERVWDTMLDEESYRLWTAAFTEGSYFEGDWDQGSRIRFLAPSGGGMVAEIADNRPYEFISIRHLGFVANGVEDTESEAVRDWAPAYENYSFESVPEGTRVIVDQDLGEEFEANMVEAWEQALRLLKELCERPV